MREVTVRIPDEKFEFCMELFEQLGLQTEAVYEIPEEHKKIVLQRIKMAEKNPERLLDWEKIKDEFDFE